MEDLAHQIYIQTDILTDKTDRQAGMITNRHIYVHTYTHTHMYIHTVLAMMHMIQHTCNSDYKSLAMKVIGASPTDNTKYVYTQANGYTYTTHV